MTLNGPAMKRNKIVKWNEMEYNGMKWNENGMKWNEIGQNGVKWNEME